MPVGDTEQYWVVVAGFTGSGGHDQPGKNHPVFSASASVRCAAGALVCGTEWRMLWWRSMFRSGLLCVSYFACGLAGAPRWRKYAVDSQQLAQRRGHDLASLSEGIAW